MPNLPAETFNKAKLKHSLSVACNKIKENKNKRNADARLVINETCRASGVNLTSKSSLWFFLC